MTAMIIWFLAGVGLVLAGLSTRAFLLEKREGLPRSSIRCALSIVIALGIVAMGVYQSFLNKPAGAVVQKPGAAEHDKDTQAKIDALKKDIAGLEDQLAKKQAELEKLDPTAAPPEEP